MVKRTITTISPEIMSQLKNGVADHRTILHGYQIRFRSYEIDQSGSERERVRELKPLELAR